MKEIYDKIDHTAIAGKTVLVVCSNFRHARDEFSHAASRLTDARVETEALPRHLEIRLPHGGAIRFTTETDLLRGYRFDLAVILARRDAQSIRYLAGLADLTGAGVVYA